MTYATRADLDSRFDADEISDLVAGKDISAILDDASAEIDTILASAYSLPLTVEVPVLVV